MSRFTMFILLALVVLFALFAFYNQAPVTIHLGRAQTTEITLAEVVLLSMGVGAFSVLLIFFLRELRKAYSNFQENLARKRRVRAEELYQKGVDAHLSGRLDSAVDLLTEAQRKDPSYLPAFYRLGVLYRDLGRHQEALDIHLKARASNPRNLRTLMNLTDDYLAMKRLPEAMGVLREILSRDDGNRTALRRLREVQEKAGNWEGAVDSQRKLMKLAGKDPGERAYLQGLIYQYALRYMEKGNHRIAARFLQVILRESPAFVPALVALGAADIARGKVEEGITVLEKGYGETRNPVFLEELEDHLIRLENPERLIRLFRTLTDAYPSDVLLTLFYGKTCLRLEMVDEAFFALKKVESTGYDSPLLHALLGETSFRRERYGEACEEYRLSLQMSWASTPIYRCGVCGQEVEGWMARCPSCQAWNSFTIPKTVEAVSLPSAPRYEGMS